MKCLYNKPNFTRKHALKRHLNRFYRQLKFKKVLAGVHSYPLTFEYSYMKCLYNKSNFTSKHGLKMHKNRYYRHLKFNFFLGGNPRTPLQIPLSCSPPARAFGPRGTPMAFNGRTTFQNPTTALFKVPLYTSHLYLRG